MIEFHQVRFKNFLSTGNEFNTIDLSKYPKTLILGDNGSGKSQPISELVLTPNGWQTLGNIKVGDKVISSTGQPVSVLAIHPQGEIPVYNIKFESGRNVRASEDHLWMVDTLIKERFNYKLTNSIKTTKQLLNDTVKNYVYCGYYKYGKSVNYAYILGIILGGCDLNSDDIVYIANRAKLGYIGKVFRNKYNVEWYDLKYLNSVMSKLYFRWTDFGDAIYKYWGTNNSELLGEDKNWHEWDYDSRLELLRGLYDSNGAYFRFFRNNYNKFGNIFKHTNLNIVQLFQSILFSLGGTSKTIQNREYIKDFNYYELNFKLNQHPTHIDIESASSTKVFTIKDVTDKIVEIEKLDYLEESVCIEVDAPDHLYVTTDYILTHNSSSLLDTVTFALFGKSHRNINKPQLINSTNQSDLVVELLFSKNGKSYKIIRGLKPNIFEVYVNDINLPTLSSSKDAQRLFEETILGFNYNTFNNIAILGSGNYTPFMELPLASRRSMIESVLDISIFGVMNSIVKDRIKSITNSILSLDTDLSILSSNLDLRLNYIKKIKNDKTSDINNKNALIHSLSEQFVESTTNMTKLQMNIELINSELNGVEDCSDKLPYYQKFLNKYEVKKNIILKNIDFYNKHSSCPTCNQSISPELKELQLSTSKSDVQTINVDITRVNDNLEKVKKHLLVRNGIVTKLQTAQNEYRLLQQKCQLIKDNIRTEQTELKRLESLSAIDLDSEHKLLLESEVRLNEVKLEKVKLTNSVEQYKILLDLFSDVGIKSKIIDKYIPLFNQTINYYLDLMGLNIDFTFDYTFKEVIKSRGRDEFSYSSFSEGEKTKINLAILFAFRKIAQIRNSLNTNLLILDEVFDNSLDYDSNQSLMQLLLDFVNYNIFVISHRNDIKYDYFNSVLKFSKVQNFSTVSQVQL